MPVRLSPTQDQNMTACALSKSRPSVARGALLEGTAVAATATDPAMMMAEMILMASGRIAASQALFVLIFLMARIAWL